jgi:RNA-directed DNA polymerase
MFESVCGVIGRRLKLKVNREKSSIRHAADATLLGFGFRLEGPQVRIWVTPKAIRRLKDQLRTLTRRNWGVPMEYHIGKINRFITAWMAYFRLADTGNLVRETDRWLRHRLRQVRWKEWKTTAARRHNLRIRGIAESNVRKWGGSGKGYWRIAAPRSLAWPCPIPSGNTSARKP